MAFDDLELDGLDFKLPPLQLGKKKKEPSLTEPYDQPTQDSLLDSMLNKSMGFLQFLGDTVNKGGRIIRAPLAAAATGDLSHLRELGNVIPFSDTIGITDPTQQVSGRDLLEQAGALAPNQAGLDLGDAAGFAADLLTDPTTFVGLGGLTAAGKTAEAGATLTKGLGAGIRAGERGLLDVGVPFGNFASRHLGLKALESVPVGMGETAAKIADTAAWPLNKLRWSKAGRESASLFDQSVGRTTSEVGQKTYRAKVSDTLMPDTAKETFGDFANFQRLKETGEIVDNDFTRALRGGAEGIHVPGEFTHAGRPELEEAVTIGKQLGDDMKSLLTEAQKRGIPLEGLDDNFIEYLYRSHNSEARQGVIKNLRDAIKSSDRFASKGRLDFLKNLPGGTNQVEDLLQDPRIWDYKFKDAAKLIEAKGIDGEQSKELASWVRSQDKSLYHRPLPITDQPLSPVGPAMNPVDKLMLSARSEIQQGNLPFYGDLHGGPNSAFSQSFDKYLDKKYGSAPVANATGAAGNAPAYVKTTEWTGKKYFNNDPISDGVIRKVTGIRHIKESDFVHSMLQENSVKLTKRSAANAKVSGDYVSVTKLMQQAGLTHADDAGLFSGETHLAGLMGIDPTKIVPRGSGKKGVKGLNDLWVPREIAADVTKVAQSWKSPEELAKVLKIYDAGLQLFKASSTQLWPGFHNRNFLSGMFYNVASGAFDPHMRALKAAYDLRMGKEVAPETLQILGLSNTGQLAAELNATGTLKSNQITDLVGPTANQAGIGLNTIPDVATNPWRAAIKNVKEGVRSVKEAKGIGGKLAAGWDAAVNAGVKVGGTTEDILRANQFISRRLQGWTPEAAAMDVKKWLFNYGELTKFEKNVMKRVVPFYGFMRRNTPLVINELMQSPGGLIGQSIKATNAIRQDHGYLPEHIGEGIAIPVPGNPDRFITGLGLPFENILPIKIAGSIDQTIKRTGESALSQLTPAITAPYSIISGREPFFGRENKDLFPFPFPKGMPGSQTLNTIANKAIGRPITEIRKGLDDRKSIPIKASSLFTGLKITDLSGGIERQKALEANRILKDELDDAVGVKSTEHFYLDPANKGKPQDSEALKFLKLKRGLEKQGKAYIKNRSPYENILLGDQ